MVVDHGEVIFVGSKTEALKLVGPPFLFLPFLRLTFHFPSPHIFNPLLTTFLHPQARERVGLKARVSSFFLASSTPMSTPCSVASSSLSTSPCTLLDLYFSPQRIRLLIFRSKDLPERREDPRGAHKARGRLSSKAQGG